MAEVMPSKLTPELMVAGSNVNEPPPLSVPDTSAPPVMLRLAPDGTASEPAAMEPEVADNARVDAAATDTPTRVRVELDTATEPDTVAPEDASSVGLVTPPLKVPVTANVLLPLSAIVPTQAPRVRVKGVPIVVVAPAKGP
jgi:hypothetical protein